MLQIILKVTENNGGEMNVKWNFTMCFKNNSGSVSRRCIPEYRACHKDNKISKLIQSYLLFPGKLIEDLGYIY